MGYCKIYSLPQTNYTFFDHFETIEMGSSNQITTIGHHGNWLPQKYQIAQKWLSGLIEQVDASTTNLHPVLEEFQEFIESDPTMRMLFTQMFLDVPYKAPYDQDPAGKSEVRDYKHMLALFNVILTLSPPWQENDLVGFPIYAILDWPMRTPSGFAAFLRKDVNAQFKKMFDVWSQYLSTPESANVLNNTESGWFGPSAMKAMPNFAKTFVCDPSVPHYGFRSWDDFFTRRFREGIRPVEDLTNDRIIVNACESAPYRLVQNVSARDSFWLKGQPYSVLDMLANDEWAQDFVGGTVYQAFLDALSYHRWHSPVAGKVIKIIMVPGTYYSEPPSSGVPDSDLTAPYGNESQAYITSVATRLMIFIEADNRDIGLMCFMAVGMAEVSTCEATIHQGQHVDKGHELGTFHFGGSTHCLFFRKGVNIKFDLQGQTPGLNAKNIKLGTAIAVIA